MSTNGNGVADWKSKRRERLALQEDIAIAALSRRKKMVESFYGGGNWANDYLGMFDGFSTTDGGPWIPISTRSDRKHGANWPIFRTEQQLALYRGPARVLCSTNSYAKGLLRGLRAFVIGTGFTYRAVPIDRNGNKKLAAAVQRVIDEFTERERWKSWERELFLRSRRDGEYFLRHFVTDDGKTSVRSVEPEQVTQKPSEDQTVWSFGIKTADGDVQTPEMYWVVYDEALAAQQGEDVPVDEMVHFKANVDRAIKRGFTDFACSTYDALSIADKLRRSLGEGAAVQSSIAGVRQHDGYSADQVSEFQSGQTDYTRTDPVTGKTQSFQQAHPGQFLDMPKGVTWVNPPGAMNAEAHIAVLDACCRGAAAAWNAPEWLVSASAQNMGAYTSSLVAESPFVIGVKSEQEEYQYCFLRTMKIVVQNAMDAGRLPANTWDEVKLIAEPPVVEHRDKLQEAQTSQIYVMLGAKSRQTVAQEQGWDWEQIQQDNEDYQDRMGGGLSGPLPGPQGMGQGGGQPSPFGPRMPNPMQGVEGLTEAEKDDSGHCHDKAGHWVGCGEPGAIKASGEKVKGHEKEYAGTGTKSKAFKEWFGDWENDPANASMVVDTKTGEPKETYEVGQSKVLKDGKPVVVYHGSARGGFDEFRKDRIKDPDGLLYGPGFYFTEDKGIAAEYTRKDADKQELSRPLTADDAKRVHKWIASQADIDHADKLTLQQSAFSAYQHGTMKAFEDDLATDAGVFPKSAEKVRQFLGVDVKVAGSEVKEVYLNIRKPFDVEAMLTGDEMKSLLSKMPPKMKAFARFYEEGAPAEALFRIAKQERVSLVKVNAALAKAGYDGITHIGGSIRGGGHEHRVWIAFEPNQIKTVKNRGTFNPHTAKIHEALTEAEESADDWQERLELMADILGGIFGDDALDLFDNVHDTPESLTEAWSSIDHPRNKHGRFIPKGSAEAVAAAKDKVKEALKAEKAPDSLRSVTEHMSILTVKQLHGLKQEYGLKASAKTRAELVQKLGDRLDRGRREPGEKKAKADPVAATRTKIADQFKALLDKHANLTPEMRQEYHAAVMEVAGRMSPKAVSEFTRNVKAAEFHETTAKLTETLKGMSPKIAAKIKPGQRIGGAYSNVDQKLILDGGTKMEGKEWQASHVYAHEFGHAIDGPRHAYSSRMDWRQVWKHELSGGNPSRYAKTSPQEGFAEFSRLVHTADPKEVEKQFPRAVELWKRWELWP